MLKRCFVLCFLPFSCFLSRCSWEVSPLHSSFFQSISQYLYMNDYSIFLVLELPAHPSISVCLTDVCLVDMLKVLQDKYVPNWFLVPPEAKPAPASGLCLDLWSHLSLTFHPHVQLVSKYCPLYLTNSLFPFLFLLLIIVTQAFVNFLGFWVFLFAFSLVSGVSPVHPVYCFCIWIDIFLFEGLNLPVACIIKSKLFSLILTFLCGLLFPILPDFYSTTVLSPGPTPSSMDSTVSSVGKMFVHHRPPCLPLSLSPK